MSTEKNEYRIRYTCNVFVVEKHVPWFWFLWTWRVLGSFYSLTEAENFYKELTK